MADVHANLTADTLPSRKAQLTPLDTSLLRVRSNSELEAEKEASRIIEIKDKEVIESLAAQIRLDWQRAKQAKLPIEEIMLRNLRQIEGKYDPDQEAAIASTGASAIYVLLTDQKCRDAESWVRDILEQAGDKTWSLEPEPVSELSPEIEQSITQKVITKFIIETAQMNAAQGLPFDSSAFAREMGTRLFEVKKAAKELLQMEATRRAEEMEKLITTQCDEGGFQKALNDVIIDLTRFKAAILKGPVPRRRKSLKWVRGSNGSYAVETNMVIKLDFERVNPFDFYPLVGVTDIQNGGVIEMHRLTRQDLNEMLGAPGYKDGEIRAVLDEYGAQGWQDWTQLTTKTEEATIKDESGLDIVYSDRIDALQYWGTMPGKLLREWGMTPKQIPSESHEYPVEAWLIGTHVIKCVLNPDPLGRKPYSITGFAKEPDSVWHKSLPETVRPDAILCNATARAIHNNVAVAAGPQIEVNKDRVALGGDSAHIWPFKVWEMTEAQGQAGGQAVHFFQPSMVSDKLLEIYQHFKKEADEHSRIPSYAHEAVGTAGQTAAGLSMLMTSDSRGVKLLLENLDSDIIGPVIDRTFAFNMLYGEDNEIKGAANVKVKGIHALVAKEQLAIRTKELYRDTQNPTDFAIMGLEGRTNFLKKLLRILEIAPEEIIKGTPSAQQLAPSPPISPTPGPGASPIGVPGAPPGQVPGLSAPGGTPEMGASVDVAGIPSGGTDTRAFGGA